ncbi:MAG: hypothetical protein FWC80_05880 [Firmicutes bacterium]|nr:hypothetical protein [Bacillota bacterium]
MDCVNVQITSICFALIFGNATVYPIAGAVALDRPNTHTLFPVGAGIDRPNTHTLLSAGLIVFARSVSDPFGKLRAGFAIPRIELRTLSPSRRGGRPRPPEQQLSFFFPLSSSTPHSHPKNSIKTLRHAHGFSGGLPIIIKYYNKVF